MEEKKNDLEFSVCSVTHIHAYLLKPASLLSLFFFFFSVSNCCSWWERILSNLGNKVQGLSAKMDTVVVLTHLFFPLSRSSSFRRCV